MIAALFMLAAAGQGLDCANAMAQQDMNQCAQRDFERADAEMNAQWRITAAAMKESDRHIDRRYDHDAGYFDTLLAAQRAWLTYRDNHCLLESFEARGGSMAPMLVSGCKAAMTTDHIIWLKSLVEED